MFRGFKLNTDETYFTSPYSVDVTWRGTECFFLWKAVDSR